MKTEGVNNMAMQLSHFSGHQVHYSVYVPQRRPELLVSDTERGERSPHLASLRDSLQESEGVNILSSEVGSEGRSTKLVKIMWQVGESHWDIS